MSITFELADQTPPHCVEILDIWLADGELPYRFTTDLTQLLPHIARLDCYAMLESLDAHLYVKEAIDIDLDVFVLVVSTYIDDPQFTRYLLARGNAVPMIDIYQHPLTDF